MQTYPGVYRSQCVAVNGAVITAKVPQVFGVLDVPIGSVTGVLPKVDDTGWVAFEAGLPQRPVWVSAGGIGLAGLIGPAGPTGPTGAAGAGSKFTTTIGDTVSTSFVVTHSLGTRDVITSVYDTGTFEVLAADVTNTSTNTITIVFADAPASGQMRVVVIG